MAGTLTHQSDAQVRVVDDFTDGSWEDDSPLTWNIGDCCWGSGDLSIDANGLTISGQGAIPVFPTLDDRAFINEDTSYLIEAQMTRGVYVAIYSRSESGIAPDAATYFGGVDQQGRIAQQEWDRSGRLVAGDNHIVHPSFPIYDTEVSIQFDTIGDALNLWVWPVGEERPASPQIEVTDTSIDSGGKGIAFLSNNEIESVSIRSFEMTVFPRNEQGDVNGDQLIDITDLNLITADANNPDVHRLRSDTNGDLRVNASDVYTWIKDIKNTFVGDADLDGEFDSSDLVQVFDSGHYEDNVEANSSWATGDWNGDQEFDSGDLVAAFEDGGYENGRRELQAVPEPSSSFLLALAVMGLGLFRTSCGKNIL